MPRDICQWHRSLAPINPDKKPGNSADLSFDMTHVTAEMTHMSSSARHMTS